VEANNTGGQGSRRAVAPSDDDEISPWSRVLPKKLTYPTPQYLIRNMAKVLR
jgi:hypothetical protein